MRLSSLRWLSIAALALAPSASVASPPATPTEASADPAPEDDLLGELVVEANKRPALVLPKIAVLSPPEGETSTLHEILKRDLQLSGEFEVVQLDQTLGFDDPFDATAFADAGLEAVVTARTQRADDGDVELKVRVFLPKVGDLPAWSSAATPGSTLSRLAAHRLSDGVIGALTGTNGPFASRLVLVRTEGKTHRRAYRVDADGKGLTPVSSEHQLVVTATLDRDAQPYWAASERNGRYRLYRDGQAEPITLSPAGSIYGVAFAPNGVDVAMAIASGDEIQVFGGALAGGALTAQTKLDFALTPTFAPDGRLVYAGTRGKRRSIYVGTKAVSAKEVSASSPTVCNHPDGPLLIYTVGLGKNTDLVSSRLDGQNLTRLTWGSARNFAPACSPDGRLVAFFSTRDKNEGPGLYLMRVDGRRPKRINAAIGDVLAWARVPLPAKKPAPEPAPPSTEPPPTESSTEPPSTEPPPQ